MLLLVACDGAGTATTSTTTTTPETSATAESTTTLPPATTTTSPTITTITTEGQEGLGPIYTIAFSAEATGVVELDTDTGEVVREVTGAIGEGSDSLDYIRDGDSLIYSRVVTAAMSEVVHVPASGDEPAVVAIGSSADATDDGSRLAVARLELVDGGPDQMVLEIRDFEGNVIRSWSDDSAAEEPVVLRNLAWSPDGARLAFEMRFEDGTEVLLLDPEADPGSIQETARVMESDRETEGAMLSSPFWITDDRLGVIEACCELPTFESWEAVIINPATGERQSLLFAVDYGIVEVDANAHGDEIAFISSHDAFGFTGDGPDTLKIWTPNGDIVDIREEQNSVGW